MILSHCDLCSNSGVDNTVPATYNVSLTPCGCHDVTHLESVRVCSVLRCDQPETDTNCDVAGSSCIGEVCREVERVVCRELLV